LIHGQHFLGQVCDANVRTGYNPRFFWVAMHTTMVKSFGQDSAMFEICDRSIALQMKKNHHVSTVHISLKLSFVVGRMEKKEP